jgi:hypothetical protein
MTRTRCGALALALAAAACADAPQRLVAPRAVAGLEIAPFARHEECFVLAQGERVTYRFSAGQPVGFAVEFRDGNAVIAPVAVARTTEEAGDFVAERDLSYCLTWEAGAAGARLDYRVQPVRPRT